MPPSTTPVKNWLETYDRKSTRFGYASAIYSYLDHIYGLRRDDKPDYEKYAKKYLTSQRIIKDDVINFQKNSGKPTRTIQSYTSIIFEFLRYYDKNLKYSDIKDIRKKTPKRFFLKAESELTPEKIKTLLTHCDVRMKALVLTLISSGCRISETLSIGVSDLQVCPEGIGKIKLAHDTTKTGRERYVFISPEAVNAISEWQKVRAKYVREKKTTDKTDNGLLFPFSKVNASIAFINVLKRAGLYEQDERTGNATITFHLFRKFYISNLKLKISPEIVEFLAGHSEDIEAIYRRYTEKQVMTEYLKGLEVLCFETDIALKQKYAESVDKINNLEVKYAQNTENVSALTAIIASQQKEMETMKAQLDLVKRVFDGIETGKLNIESVTKHKVNLK